jgi:hypothetical protein
MTQRTGSSSQGERSDWYQIDWKLLNTGSFPEYKRCTIIIYSGLCSQIILTVIPENCHQASTDTHFYTLALVSYMGAETEREVINTRVQFVSDGLWARTQVYVYSWYSTSVPKCSRTRRKFSKKESQPQTQTLIASLILLPPQSITLWPSNQRRIL